MLVTFIIAKVIKNGNCSTMNMVGEKEIYLSSFIWIYPLENVKFIVNRFFLILQIDTIDENHYFCCMNIIEGNIDRLKRLCKKYKVDELYVFGSALDNRFSPDSDIDFIVSFDKIDLEKYADNYFDFKFSLEDLFGRKIDLLEEKAIKNPFLKKSINSSKKLIYG
jgi:predicted nucleotidyltransferase